VAQRRQKASSKPRSRSRKPAGDSLSLALRRERAQRQEGLKRERAASAILSLIAKSRAATQPVFDAVSESAARLWKGSDASIHLVDGDRLRLVAHSGPIASAAIGSFMPIAAISRKRRFCWSKREPPTR
jgi:hypothetical protein